MTRRWFIITTLALAIVGIAAPATAHMSDVTNDHDAGPGSFRAAIERANVDGRIDRIVFQHGIGEIVLETGVVYSGSQHLAIKGRLAVLTSAGGDFDLFSSIGGADLTISSLDFEGGGGKGVVVDVPADATGEVVVLLTDVSIADHASFGLHIDDSKGSAAGILLVMSDTSIEGNGLSGSYDDVDGVRVDETASGSIHAFVTGSYIAGNAFDGIELDESGDGDVSAVVTASNFEGNGFGNASYDEADDGLDVDEAGTGSVGVTIVLSTFSGNGDQGLDLDEEDAGDLKALVLLSSLRDSGEEGMKSTEKDDGHTEVVFVLSRLEDNGGDGAKIEEKDDGQLVARFTRTHAVNNGSDGVQLEEDDAGDLEAALTRSVLNDNHKDGFKAEQAGPGEGMLMLDDRTVLEGNGDDALDLDGIEVF